MSILRAAAAASIFSMLVCAMPGTGAPPTTKQRSPFRGRSGSSAPAEPSAGSDTQKPAAPARPTLLPDAVRRHPEGSVMEVAAVDRERRPAVATAAARIDAILLGPHAGKGATKGENIDDATFARRAWLVLGGRIPTAAELLVFLRSKEAGKREDLVDTLLESPDWVSRFYNLWADTLRLKEEPVFTLLCTPYLDWVKRSIAENRPYDEWVREMLTADGQLWDHPAVGYQLRDEGMPLAYVSNTMRVFLGTQIGCAECHDHPHEPWTQRQFYELAAFTAGTETGRELATRKLPDGTPETPSRAMLNFQAYSADLQARSRRAQSEGTKFEGGPYLAFLRANRTRVGFRPLDLTLPHDYRYRDGSPGEAVTPRVPWGAPPPVDSFSDSRRALADWMTSRDNRRFAGVIANRLWKMCFGVGVVEPIDDFSDTNPPSNPALLDELTDLMLALDFDQREFVRTVVSTEAWQRRAVSHDPTSGEPFAFDAPALRRMSAEQLWDSMLAMIARDRWAYQRPTYEEYAWMREFDLTAERPDFDAGYALYGTFRDRLSDVARATRLDATVKFLGVHLAPASELPLPLPAAHFLRAFGQGDRETIDGSRTVPTVPQILEIIHGGMLVGVLDPCSLVKETIAANPPARAIDIVFLSSLSRLPTDDERRFVAAAIAAAPSPEEGLNDVLYALVNTREFLFVQ